jgi:4-diphosphocytidyl-2-C-methyl-D-erythritol kinase
MHTRSFAKINLGLEVLRKRENGYHEIRTLFQTVDLSDMLEFQPLRQNRILLEGNDETVPWDESNLIYKAVRLLKERFKLKTGIRVIVEKNIPAGKGLGGGSSNAAATLWSLNKIWDLGLEKGDFMDLGRLLGADVPYFFEGGLCLGEDTGNRITPLDDIPPCLCVLALPSFSLSTAAVYGQVPSSLTSRDKDSKIIKFLDSRNLSLLVNDLEEIVFKTHPQIKAIRNLFQKQGSELALMSGSGSAVFGLFLEKEKAEGASRMFMKEHAVVLAETLPRDGYLRRREAGV